MSRPIVVIVCMDAPPNRGSFNSAHIRGTHVPVEEPSTASLADMQGGVSCPSSVRDGLWRPGFYDPCDRGIRSRAVDLAIQVRQPDIVAKRRSYLRFQRTNIFG